MSSANGVPSKPLSKLCVLGMGLFVEMLEQSDLWSEMNGNSKKCVLPNDPKAYNTMRTEKHAALDRRGAKSLAKAIGNFVRQWPIPCVSILPDLRTDDDGYMHTYFAERVSQLKALAGLPSHQIVSAGVFSQDNPEEVLERAFQFMEGYPDVPAILLFASDGDLTRSLTGDSSRQQYWHDGPRRFGSMCETVVAILLAHPERVDRLKPFAANLDVASNLARPIPPGFKPSKYVPTPWTVDQLKQFYSVMPLAELHRPVRISYRKDKEGKQTFDLAAQTGSMRTREKEECVKAGLNTALDGLDVNCTNRIFYDTGAVENGSHVVPLSVALGDALPDLDMFSAEQGYDIHNRVGNTGAASPLLQWALAALATSQHKDICLTANLRQKDEITITAVSPATVVYRKAAPAKQDVASPVSSAPLQSTTVHVALGARLHSGGECTQSGMWRCDPPDAEAGANHFIMMGRKLPPVRIKRNLSVWQKTRGESEYDVVSATYTLVSYEIPHL